jgi:hypothetical protein
MHIQKIFSVGQNMTHTIQNEQTGLKRPESENAGTKMAQGQYSCTAESAQKGESRTGTTNFAQQKFKNRVL